jgi:hypothetical protein
MSRALRNGLAAFFAAGILAACSEGRSKQSADTIRSPSAAAFSADTVLTDSAAALGIIDSLGIRMGSVLKVLSDSGATFYDVNEADTEIHLTLPEIEAQLAAQHGRAYTSLARYAETEGNATPGYPRRLAFAHMPDGVDVKVGDYYEFSFVRENGRLHVRRIGFTNYQVD